MDGNNFRKHSANDNRKVFSFTILFIILYIKYDIFRHNETSGKNIQRCNGFYKVYKMLTEKMSDPSRYISMISLYETIYEEKMSFIQEKQNKLNVKLTHGDYFIVKYIIFRLASQN